MVNVTAVHMTSGNQHERIAEVRWKNPSSGKTGASSRQTMVEWIRDEGGVAKVHASDGSASQVGVVNAAPPYIRTYADGNWNDNLLALPRY